MSDRHYLVILEVRETQYVQIRAKDDQDAVVQAQKLVDSGARGDASVDWVHALVPIHHA